MPHNVHNMKYQRKNLLHNKSTYFNKWSCYSFEWGN